MAKRKRADRLPDVAEAGAGRGGGVYRQKGVRASEDRDIKDLGGVLGVRLAVRGASGRQRLGKTEIFLRWPPVRYR